MDFTLLESLVVVPVIGLLSGLVAPDDFGQIGKAEVTTAKAQISALEKALGYALTRRRLRSGSPRDCGRRARSPSSRRR